MYIKRISVILTISFISSCSCIERDIGTETNPVIIEVLTSAPISSVIGNIENLAKFIEKESGLKTSVYAPKKNIEYIQALSSSKRKADVAILNDVGYLFAKDEYGATAELITLRYSSKNETATSYCSAIISVSLKSLEELNGKKIAFSSEYSTAGYLIPLYNLKEKGISCSEKLFAGSYTDALRMLLSGRVDAAAIYTSCDSTSNELDSRSLLLKEYPDIFTRTVVIFKSPPIPNEPVVFRKGIKKEIKEKIISALMRCPEDSICRDSLISINRVVGFKRVRGNEYDNLRQIIKSLEKDTADLIQGGWILRIGNTVELPRSGN
ncbi:MAG: phosphate/phosphite/phosphonate ABC transporter substrate-binding protein [Myxococcota bacterium]